MRGKKNYIYIYITMHLNQEYSVEICLPPSQLYMTAHLSHECCDSESLLEMSGKFLDKVVVVT